MSESTRKTLRTVSKIFIIVGAVLTCYLIYPVVLAFFAWKWVDKEDGDQTNRIIWAVVTLFLVSQISGILMLIDVLVKDEKPAVEEKKE